MSESLDHCRLIAEFHTRHNDTPPSIETPAQFLLARGTVMQARGNPPRTLGFPQACYYNAYRLARRRKNLRYAEGFALSIIPVEHAWCVDEQGRVVEPTWEEEYTLLSALTGERERPTDYFGMTFDLDVVRAVRKVTRSYTVLWDFFHWAEVYPILKGIQP